MNKLMFLFCALLGHLLEIHATVVKWPPGYSVEWSMEDESNRYSMAVKHYKSEEEKALRWDIFGGVNTYMLKLKDEKTSGIYYYFPTNNETANDVMNCYFVRQDALKPGVKLKFGLWDLNDNYRHSQNLTVGGTEVQKWTWSRDAGKQKDTFWLNAGSKTEGPIPVKGQSVHYKGEDDASYLNAQRITVDYYNYKPNEPDKSTWDGPENVKCQLANPETAELIKDFVNYVIGNVFRLSAHPHSIKYKYKGLKISSTPLDSVLPFPYTDDEVQDKAASLPKSFDWRLHGAVTEVKNQGMCGSCWAFGTVGSLEGAYFLKTGVLGDISEQALMDCSWWNDPQYNSSNAGCFGGDPPIALDWIKSHGGLPWTVDYGDYKQINGRCTLSNMKLVAPIKGAVKVSATMDAVKVALCHHGPLAVSIYTPPAFFQYTNGVFTSDRTGISDHCVLLIGYGSLDGEDYWLIKNSWGEHWGLRGYGLISTANDMLNLLDSVYYPELV